MSCYRVGFTIGPIYKVFQQATAPVSSWAASYIFSYTMKQLATHVMQTYGEGDGDLLILPYLDFDETGRSITKESSNLAGIGRYPDRAFFQITTDLTANELKTGIAHCIRETKNDVRQALPDDYLGRDEFVESELYIEFVIQPSTARGEPTVKRLNRLLDVAEENAGTQLEFAHDYINEIFNERRNEPFQERFMDVEQRHNPLALSKDENRGYADISSIARRINHRDRKASRYYAVVSFDGDSTGKAVEGKEESEVMEFSERIYTFVGDAVDLITSFGGVVLFAGGEDFKCLMPLANAGHDRTFIDVCRDINKKFNEVVGAGSDTKLSVSFGVAIAYYKYPLAEAFQQSLDLLDGVAKRQKGKNTMAIHLEKASGQSLTIGFKNDSPLLGKISKEVCSLLRDDEKAAEGSEKLLHSFVYRFNELKHLFAIEHASEEHACNLIQNTFDTSEHHGNKVEDHLEFVKDLYRHRTEIRDILTNEGAVDSAASTNGSSAVTMRQERERYVDRISHVLRFIKFFAEKGVNS